VASITKSISRFLSVGAGEAPSLRVWRGLRTGDQRELLTGAAIMGYRWLRTSKGGRELVYRKAVPEGSAVVIRYGKRGQMTDIEVRKLDELT